MRRIALVSILAIAACGGDDVLPPPTGVVTGGLRITWRLVTGAGAAQTCAEARIDQVSIDIGKVPVERPCTDGEITFGSLLPERYPIVAQALTVSGVPRATLMTNGVVTAGSTVTVDLSFLADPTAGQAGDLAVRWRIDSRDPRTQCGLVGADFARITSGAGSIASFDVRLPCIETDTVIRDLRPGVYVPQVALERTDGTRLAIAVGEAIRVEPDRLVDTGNIDVITVSGAPTRLVALWTVNSTAAADACATVNGRTVTLTTVPRPGIVASSTTVACTRGRAELRDGIGIGDIDVRLTLQYGVASVTSTTVPDVPIRRGRTSTVVHDFRAE